MFATWLLVEETFSGYTKGDFVLGVLFVFQTARSSVLQEITVLIT